MTIAALSNLDMNSATHSPIFLLLVLPIFLLTGAEIIKVELPSPTREVDAEIGKVSGTENAAQGEQSTEMLTKLRVLFGIPTSSSSRKQWSPRQVSQDQAPEAAVPKIPSPLPPLYNLHFYHRAPAPHRWNPNPSPENTATTMKKYEQMIEAISVSVLATLAVSVIMANLLLAYRGHQKTRKLSSGSNKVSFDPEPEKFYLDSLAPFLECNSDHNLSFESKCIGSAESIITRSLQNEGMCTFNSKNYSHTVAGHVECSSSDGNESFHSVRCSHYSIESIPIDFDHIFDCSPHGHLSPRSRLTELSTLSSKKPLCSAHFISSIVRKPPSSLLPQSLGNNPGNDDNIETLLPSQSPCIEMRFGNNSASMELQSTSGTSNTVSASRTKQEFVPIPVDVMTSEQFWIWQSDATQQLLKPTVRNGNIPKSLPLPPPPPPPPPPRPPFLERSFVKLAPPTLRLQQSPAAVEAGSPLPKLKPLH